MFLEFFALLFIVIQTYSKLLIPYKTILLLGHPISSCRLLCIHFIFKKKQENFYQDGILALPEKWEEVVQREGDYIFS